MPSSPSPTTRSGKRWTHGTASVTCVSGYVGPVCPVAATVARVLGSWRPSQPRSLTLVFAYYYKYNYNVSRCVTSWYANQRWIFSVVHTTEGLISTSVAFAFFFLSVVESNLLAGLIIASSVLLLQSRARYELVLGLRWIDRALNSVGRCLLLHAAALCTCDKKSLTATKRSVVCASPLFTMRQPAIIFPHLLLLFCFVRRVVPRVPPSQCLFLFCLLLADGFDTSRSRHPTCAEYSFSKGHKGILTTGLGGR